MGMKSRWTKVRLKSLNRIGSQWWMAATEEVIVNVRRRWGWVTVRSRCCPEWTRPAGNDCAAAGRFTFGRVSRKLQRCMQARTHTLQVLARTTTDQSSSWYEFGIDQWPWPVCHGAAGHTLVTSSDLCIRTTRSLITPTMSVGVGRTFETICLFVCLSVCPQHNSKTNDSKCSSLV